MFTIEEENGTCTGSTVRRHNGYHAGDFTRNPMCTAGELSALVRLWLPTFPTRSANAG